MVVSCRTDRCPIVDVHCRIINFESLSIGGGSDGFGNLNGLVDLIKPLLALGLKYICIGKMQSDRLEAAKRRKLLDICGTNHKQSYFAKNEALSQA